MKQRVRHLNKKTRYVFRIFSGFLIAVVAVALGIGLRSWHGDGFRFDSENKQNETPPITTQAAKEQENVNISLSLTSDAASSTLGHRVTHARVQVQDQASLTPLARRKIMTWFEKTDSSEELGTHQCKESIRSHLAGELTAQSAVNLNAWHLYAMNDDHSISVINPQLGFSKTKLKNLITLAGYPVDWVLAPERDKLFVSIPARGLVAVIDAFKGRLLQNIEVGRKPVRFLAPSGSPFVFIGDDDSDHVHLVDRTTLKVSGSWEVGDGHKEFIIKPDDQDDKAFVFATGGTKLVEFDLKTGKVLAAQAIDVGTVAGGFAGDTLILVNELSGLVSVGKGDKILGAYRLELSPGIAPMAVSRDGRWVFIADPKQGTVTIVDPAKQQIRHVVTGLSNPDQIQMSDRYAYMRSLGKTGMTLVQLASLDSGNAPSVSEIQIGIKEAALADDVGIASAFAQSPDGSGMLIASPSDKNIYFYQEGMMAPTGTFKNYSRQPRSIIVADWSLRETAPGHYETQVMFPSGGLYDVYVLLSDPRVGSCFKIAVPEGMAMPGLDRGEEPKLTWTHPWTSEKKLTVGDSSLFKFQASLSHPVGGNKFPETKDLVLRGFYPPAGPSQDFVIRASDGGFEAEIIPRYEGQLVLMLGLKGQEIDFTTHTSFRVGVNAALVPQLKNSKL